MTLVSLVVTDWLVTHLLFLFLCLCRDWFRREVPGGLWEEGVWSEVRGQSWGGGATGEGSDQEGGVEGWSRWWWHTSIWQPRWRMVSVSQVVTTPYQSGFINYTWSPGQKRDISRKGKLTIFRILTTLLFLEIVMKAWIYFSADHDFSFPFNFVNAHC